MLASFFPGPTTFGEGEGHAFAPHQEHLTSVENDPESWSPSEDQHWKTKSYPLGSSPSFQREVIQQPHQTNTFPRRGTPLTGVGSAAITS